MERRRRHRVPRDRHRVRAAPRAEREPAFVARHVRRRAPLDGRLRRRRRRRLVRERCAAALRRRSGADATMTRDLPRGASRPGQPGVQRARRPRCRAVGRLAGRPTARPARRSRDAQRASTGRGARRPVATRAGRARPITPERGPLAPPARRRGRASDADVLPTPEPISVSLDARPSPTCGSWRRTATVTVVEIRSPSDPAKRATWTPPSGRGSTSPTAGWSSRRASAGGSDALRGGDHSIDLDDRAAGGVPPCVGERRSLSSTERGAGRAHPYQDRAPALSTWSTRPLASARRTGAGDLVVGRTDGAVEAATGSGVVRLGSVGGTAAVKNANGDTFVGEVAGDLRASSANGTIRVERSGGSVTAKTANGDVLLGEAAPHAVDLQTADRSHRGGDPRGRRRVARPRHEVRPGGQPPRGRGAPGTGRGRARGAGAHGLRRHHRAARRGGRSRTPTMRRRCWRLGRTGHRRRAQLRR